MVGEGASDFKGKGVDHGSGCLVKKKKFFHKNIRTQTDYETFIQTIRPQLYAKGQESIKAVMAVGREYEVCFSLIQKLSLQYKDRPLPFEALTLVFNELKNLCPPNFLELYDLRRTRYLPRLLSCLKIRAQRAADNPGKENQKAELIRPFERRLEALVSGLTEDASQEKANAVEDFFWMLEEYKLSVYAQELKTRFKVSAKRLDKALIKISTMI